MASVHTCTCVCMFCMQMHAETPPVFSLAEPKGMPLFLYSFFPSTQAAFSVHIRQLYFGPFHLEWNLQSKKNKKDKREMGRISEGNMMSWVPEAAIQRFLLALPFQKKQSKAVSQCWMSRFPWHGRVGCLGKMSRNAMIIYIAHPIFRERGWFRVSRT